MNVRIRCKREPLFAVLQWLCKSRAQMMMCQESCTDAITLRVMRRSHAGSRAQISLHQELCADVITLRVLEMQARLQINRRCLRFPHFCCERQDLCGKSWAGTCGIKLDGAVWAGRSMSELGAQKRTKARVEGQIGG